MTIEQRSLIRQEQMPLAIFRKRLNKAITRTRKMNREPGGELWPEHLQIVSGNGHNPQERIQELERINRNLSKRTLPILKEKKRVVDVMLAIREKEKYMVFFAAKEKRDRSFRWPLKEVERQKEKLKNQLAELEAKNPRNRIPTRRVFASPASSPKAKLPRIRL